MNINVGIIDQQVRGLARRLRAELADALDRSNLDDTTARSAAFVVLCAKVMLELSDDEALDALTEGGNDFGVDAVELGDVSDGEFTVTLFQAKYHHENLDGVKGFPQSGVEKAVQAVRALFNPAAPVNLRRAACLGACTGPRRGLRSGSPVPGASRERWCPSTTRCRGCTGASR